MSTDRQDSSTCYPRPDNPSLIPKTHVVSWLLPVVCGMCTYTTALELLKRSLISKMDPRASKDKRPMQSLGEFYKGFSKNGNWPMKKSNQEENLWGLRGLKKVKTQLQNAQKNQQT